MGLEPSSPAFRQTPGAQSRALRPAIEEVLGQEAQVLPAVAQGRQVQGEDVQPVVEVGPETALGDRLLQVHFGGREDADIRHELDTYNALLGEHGDLGCTLLIEIEDEHARPTLLRAWRDLPGQVFLVLADGRTVPARWDDTQMDEERLSSVQFLRFPLGGVQPVGILVTHPALAVEAALSPETRRTLVQDLAAGT